MEQVGRFIVGSEKLTKIFGKWPSFHDAEVHEVFLSRDDAETGAKRASTSLITKIHVREMTSDVEANGYYVLRNHTLASFCFWGIERTGARGLQSSERVDESGDRASGKPYRADGSFQGVSRFVWDECAFRVRAY